MYLQETAAITQNPWLNTTKISRYNSSQIIWSVLHSTQHTHTHARAHNRHKHKHTLRLIRTPISSQLICTNIYIYISYLPPSEMRIHCVILAWCFRTIRTEECLQVYLLNCKYRYVGLAAARQCSNCTLCYRCIKMKGLNYVGTVDEQESCSPRGKRLQFNFVTLSSISEIKNPQHNTH